MFSPPGTALEFIDTTGLLTLNGPGSIVGRSLLIGI